MFIESPYERLPCDCQTQMKSGAAIMLGPLWYVIWYCLVCF